MKYKLGITSNANTWRIGSINEGSTIITGTVARQISPMFFPYGSVGGSRQIYSPFVSY
jgi:hypothetical protein